ncbi:hypothetical protein B0T20DRAFT_393116 [Sordaria brevicollis]|uniref:2EXR domain-containing protein n=1 Tax=Sordaria brevicollis TaxID=83679 RepID=A0AAE0PF37_SORBR|nr:hypothetical protein B0T20DRAFT_393116 [Sordaria brevicollis]
MATSFHLFPFLPWELRARVWELSAEPRTVQVTTVEYYLPLTATNLDNTRYKRVSSPTPIPAVVQTCRESRNLGVYRKCFSEVERVPERFLEVVEGEGYVWVNGVRRYVWVNLELDTIDIGGQSPAILKPVASTIKQLKSERAVMVVEDVEPLRDFSSLKELQIGCWSECSFLHCACMLMLFYNGYVDAKHITLTDESNGHTTSLFDWNRQLEERFEPYREDFAADLEASGWQVDGVFEGVDRRTRLHVLWAIDQHMQVHDCQW